MSLDFDFERSWARDWLFSAALPLWWERGADHALGGWHDKLDAAGSPLDLPKRLRVQARQTFVYAEAGRLGWEGPWRKAAQHGLDFIFDKFKCSTGLYRSAVTRHGDSLVEGVDLYDQAFVLLAMAAGFVNLGRPSALKLEAEALLGRLAAILTHPAIGFEETHPRTLPLRSNPHMHLLEALLAWVEADGGPVFKRYAHIIVNLARKHLIDPKTGAIGEYYDGDWCFDRNTGHVREPGHQYEWAYLLDRAGKVLGGDNSSLVTRLNDFATCHGIVDGRVIMSVAADGQVLDSSSRLWGQTERLRTLIEITPKLTASERDASLSGAADALKTLKCFLDTPLRGSWVDRVDQSGTWLVEPAPASSFYHIVTGLTPLIEARDAVEHALYSAYPQA